jgi:hypothetical protein
MNTIGDNIYDIFVVADPYELLNNTTPIKANMIKKDRYANFLSLKISSRL